MYQPFLSLLRALFNNRGDKRMIERRWPKSGVIALAVILIFSASVVHAVDPLDSWSLRSAGTTTIESVTYWNGSFVTVGQYGTIATSPDGVNWTLRTSGTSNGLTSVTYANSKLVAVGVFGTVLTSLDGITWISKPISENPPNDFLRGVAFGNSTCVVVGGPYIHFMNEGIEGGIWIRGTIPSKSISQYAVTYGNSKFVTVGAWGQILTSLDGITWKQEGSGTTEDLYGVTYGNFKFIAVGNFNTILTSPDGSTWTSVSPRIDGNLYSVTDLCCQ